MIDIQTTPFSDLKILVPKRFQDDRGFFVETYNAARLLEHGIDCAFVQDNLSLSRDIGTIRGLHFQIPPFAQTKLISVASGAVLDVAVDLRTASPTFGKYFAIELSQENGKQLLIPKGFAHGFCSLMPETRLTYKVDAHYSADHDAGIMWNDPNLAVKWPEVADATLLSPKDRTLMWFQDFKSPF